MSAYQQRAPKPWNDEEPSRQPPYATKSERPVYDVQMPPRRSNALVIYVAQEGPYTASFWTKGGVGGEIMVATRKTTGLINLQRGQWVSVKYIPFPLGEDDPLYIPHVKHEVIEIEEPRPGRLPLVTDINPMIQVETEIEFSPRLIEMSNFDSKGFRLAICPDMGNFYAAFPRTLETERWIDWFIRGLKKERNKSLKLRAKLCLPKCSSLCTNEIYWFVTSMYYGHREVQFGSIRDYYEGTFWPRQLDDYLFMSLNDINYEGDDSDDVAAFEDERQEATAPVHDQRALNRHLRGCSSMDQLKDFVDSYRQDFHNLLVNFDQNEAMVKKVKVAIVLLVEDLALCYSPIYGWCVVQRSVAGMGSAQFNRTFQQGKWLAVNLYPSKTDGRSYKVADWIACPTYYVCSNPPFNLFCLNADSETAIMEALAFGQVLQRVENDKGVRYLIVETELGEVWVPGSIEDPGMETEELVVTCPRNCYCNRQYRSYANPMEELDRLGNPVEDPTNWGPPQFNRRDSEGTIGRFMHEDQSGPAFQDRRSNRSMGRSDFGTEHYGRSRQQTNRERSPEISERYTRSNHHFSAERSRRNDQQRDEWSQERPTSTHNGYPHRSQERPTSVQNGYPHRSQERPTSAHNGYPHRRGLLRLTMDIPIGMAMDFRDKAVRRVAGHMAVDWLEATMKTQPKSHHGNPHLAAEQVPQDQGRSSVNVIPNTHLMWS
uniref:Tudor domain-containing protein n=1 Tax=Steinernema glaseri TaxID=37863 RepID=A0A1I8A6H8_9BILA